VNDDCKHRRTRVVSTWRAGQVKRRRIECLDCGACFNTSERRDPPVGGEPIAVYGKNRIRASERALTS